MIFAVCEMPDGCEERKSAVIVESYSCIDISFDSWYWWFKLVLVRYHNMDVSLVQKLNGKEISASFPTMKTVRDSTTNLIRSLVTVCGMLLPVPQRRFIRMELLYNERVPEVSLILKTLFP